jgi:aldehyde:ferredoxin oxidoreductase
MKFERTKDEYYGLRGWDVVTGFPRRSTLDKLGLDEVAAQMGKLKRLGVEAEGG